jgi:hypothetical protein
MKSEHVRLAPPTNALLTFSTAVNSAAFEGVTDPPYRMRAVDPRLAMSFSRLARMKVCASPPSMVREVSLTERTCCYSNS